jgi:hypothetical protein
MEDALRTIRATLTGPGGKLPRRAVVLENGEVADRTLAPERPEVPALSLACEALRRAAREAVHPRVTYELLRMCVDNNEAGAWAALLDDLATNDINDREMLAFWADAANVHGTVRCIVQARDGMHAWLVVQALYRMVPNVSPEALRAFKASFGDLVRSLARASGTSREQRAVVLEYLGKIIRSCDFSEDDLAGMVECVVRGAPDDFLRLFQHCGASTLRRRPDLVSAIVDRAQGAHATSRYPYFALMTTLGDALAPHHDRLLNLVRATLETAVAQGAADARLTLACSAVGKLVAPPRSLEGTLFHMLCCATLPHWK